MVEGDVFQPRFIYRHLLVQTIEAAENLVLDAGHSLPEDRPLVVEINTVVERFAEPMQQRLILCEPERRLLEVVDIVQEAKTALGLEDALNLGVYIQI